MVKKMKDASTPVWVKPPETEEDDVQNVLADAILHTTQTAIDEEAVDRILNRLRAFPTIPEVYTHADIDEIRTRQYHWLLSLKELLV